MRSTHQNVARNVSVLAVDETDHITGLAGLTLTITASKDGAAFASISPTVTDRGNGWYNIALTSSHCDTLGDLAIHATATGADPIDFVVNVIAAPAVAGDAMDLVNNAIDAAAMASTGADEIVDRFWLNATSIQLASDAGDAATDAAAASASAASVDTKLTSTRAGYLDNLSSGAVATLASLTSVSSQVTAVESDTQDIQSRLPAALVSGRMDSSVGAMAANVITATAIAADAITAAKVAADVTTEIQSGLATAASVAALPTAAAIADAVWDESIAGHLGVGSTGEALDNAGAAGSPPSAADIADAVWDEPRSGHVSAGSFGEGVLLAADSITSGVVAASAVTEIQAGLALSTQVDALEAAAIAIEADTQDIQSRLPATLVGGRIDASVGAMASNVITAAATAADFTTEVTSGLALSSQVDALEAAATAIEADTQDIQSRLPAALVSGRIDASVGAMAANTLTASALAADAATEIAAGISVPSAGTVADAVWDVVLEGTETAADQVRLIASFAAGDATVQDGDGSYAFRDKADTKDRIAGTVSGTDRTVTTRDGT